METVEFYDSNGSEIHELMFGKHDYNKVINFLSQRFNHLLEDYSFLTYEDTCPKKSFQYFDLFEPVENFGGFCQFWSIFNAHLRIKYPEVPPKQLQEKLLKKMIAKNTVSSFIKLYTGFLDKIVSHIQ
jgi:hypothetical protein